MSFFSSFKIFTGMLFGPDDLFESREGIISDIISDIIISDIINDRFCRLESRRGYLCLNKIGCLCNVLVKI